MTTKQIRCILCQGKKPREATIGYACNQCRDWLAGMLDEIADLYARLPGLLFPVASVGSDGKKGKRDFGPPPLRIDVLNLLGPAADVSIQLGPDAWGDWLCQHGPIPPADVLAGWVRIVQEERGYTVREMPVGRLLHELEQNLEWVCRQEWLDEFGTDLKKMRKAMRAVAAVEDGTDDTTVIGSCTHIEDGETEECGATLRARPDDTVIQCRDCQTEWPSDRWLLLGAIQRQDGEVKAS